jgi:peptidyl-dipeptidase Dcp
MTDNIENNPLIKKTPYKNQVPPFDKIKESHFIPALEYSIKKHKQEIENIKQIVDPTFENIIEALEDAGEDLDRVTTVFFHYDGVNSTDELNEIALEFKTKLTSHYSDISLDEELFSKIKSVYDQKSSLNLEEDQLLLLEDSYKSFVRNGALLSDEDKAKLRKIDEKLASLSNDFSKNVLDETNQFELIIEDESELSGLPDSAKIAAQEEAKEKGYEGKWLITLHAPSVIPVLTYADNRDLREKLWRAFTTRAKQGKFDNRQNVLDIVKCRYERAKLLGYDTHADYVLEERMAKSKNTVFDMLAEYKEISKKVALQEHKELEGFAKTYEKSVSQVEPWDVSYYAEKLKQSKFGFDSEELRPYFQFEKVREGAFEVASKLYNIRFEETDEYPKYANDISVFNVFDKNDDSLIGVFYTDYFPRSTKRAGAWMNEYVTQSYDKNTNKRKVPVIGNHGNFTKPTKNNPSLLTLEEVLTLFHEFGHGLHGLLSNTRYSSQAGPNVKWDFVELPSQLMENWVKQKEVLDMFADHYETGEKISDDLVEKLKKSENFRAASAFLRQIQFGTLDMLWHTTNPGEVEDVEKFENEILQDFYILPPNGAIVSTAFSHIFAGGYSAGYYSYKWAEILEADAFEAFKQNGLFDKETSQKFRKLLESGGSKDPQKLYVEFRGQEPDRDALLRREGLVSSSKAA